MDQTLSWSSQFEELNERLTEFEEDDDLQESDEKDEHRFFMSIFRDACAIVRDAEARGRPDFEDVFKVAEHLINKAIKVAYGEPGVFDFIPSFAHADDCPLVEDGDQDLRFSHGLMAKMLPMMRILMELPSGGELPPDVAERLPKGPKPWDASMKPHPNSTPLARFRDKTSALAVNEITPLANSIYQAQCEITDWNTSMPIHMTLSSGNSCLALNAMGGYKNRDPKLSLFDLNTSPNGEFPKCYRVNVGLSDVAYHMTTDETRKLVFVADHTRIKSYLWGSSSNDPEEEKLFKRGKAAHTMASKPFRGPLAVLPSGRIIRAGKGSIAVWNLDELDTHDVTKQIGGKFDAEESWREADCEDVELSTGNPYHSEIKLSGKPKLEPGVWRQSSDPDTMLCASETRQSEDYSCYKLNLERGNVTQTYLGHGGTVTDIHTSEAEPNNFLTACQDGYARLYDWRTTLPVMTFDVGKRFDICSSALFVHPDGIPTVFTGSESNEQIKMWDVRARSIVYELATGNNKVVSMAWDELRSVLYASTECAYLDRMGGHNAYRRAKMPPKRSERSTTAAGDKEDVTMDDEDEDDLDVYPKCWPKSAWHSEDYFGYTFDAGSHRIYRYAFKPNADTAIVPHYGTAMLNSRNW